MAVRNRQHKKLAERTVDLAVAAVIGPPNVMDMPIGGFDPSPIALGLDDGYAEMCASGRSTCTAVDECIICGSRLCDDYA